jgi:hypothetical protein
MPPEYHDRWAAVAGVVTNPSPGVTNPLSAKIPGNEGQSGGGVARQLDVL